MNPINKAPHLKKYEAVAFHAEATTDDRLPRRETVADTCQNPFLMLTVNKHDKEVKAESLLFSKPAATTKDEVSAVFSAREIEAGRDGCTTVQSDHVLEQVASSRLNIRDNHRGLLVRTRPPEKSLDPLSTFMMLRAQQTAPVGATSQSSASTPGRPMVQLVPV